MKPSFLPIQARNQLLEALLASLLAALLIQLWFNPELLVNILKPIGNIIALP